MTARVHRIITALLSSLTAVSALLAATDPQSLHVAAATWAWIGMMLAINNIVATAIRQAWDTPPQPPRLSVP